MENNLGIPQKVKHTVTMWQNISTHRYMDKRTENIWLHKKKKKGTQMSIPTLSIIAKKIKTTQIPSADE